MKKEIKEMIKKIETRGDKVYSFYHEIGTNDIEFRIGNGLIIPMRIMLKKEFE